MRESSNCSALPAATLYVPLSPGAMPGPENRNVPLFALTVPSLSKVRPLKYVSAAAPVFVITPDAWLWNWGSFPLPLG